MSIRGTHLDLTLQDPQAILQLLYSDKFTEMANSNSFVSTFQILLFFLANSKTFILLLMS